MSSRLNPYLNFNGNARQALEFYRSVFGGTLTISTYADFGGEGSPDAEKVMHGQLETDVGYTVMAADHASNMGGTGLLLAAARRQKKVEGADPTHGATAATRRAQANIARKRQAREWDERHGKLVDLSAFQRDILPLIQGVPLSRLQRTTGLSLRYVSLIRRGERTPHPRHWEALAEAAGREPRSSQSRSASTETVPTGSCSGQASNAEV